jgi:hypothetical protein
MRVLAFVPDLMDRSKLGAGVEFVRTIDELADAEPGDVVLIDLARAASLPVLADGVRSIAFGSHVDDERLAAARAAGIDDVLPRSVFFRRAAAPTPGFWTL